MSNVIVSGTTYEGVDTVQLPTANGYAVFRHGYDTIIDDGDIELPDGYSQLEKVVFAQNSYFFTDIYLTSADVIEVAFRYTSYAANKGTIFSDRSANGYGFKMTSATGIDSYRGGVRKTATISALPSDTLSTLLIFEDNSIKLAGGTVLVTGVTDGGHTSGNAVSIGEASQSIIGEVGKIKFIRDSQLCREYIPCTNPSQVVGFYELATETFYPSAGTAFSAV